MRHLAQRSGLWAQALEVLGWIPTQGILHFLFFHLRTFCLSFIFIHVTAGTIATANNYIANITM